jgi:hypothetical protein
MEQLSACPECGSTELRETTRALDPYTEIKVKVCGVCHWASDTRVGRPPADRGKNVTLRRLMRDVTEDTPQQPPRRPR